MRISEKVVVTLASAAVLFWSGRAEAALVETLADVSFWVGSGPNRSALVIDWADGRTPLAWGFRWTGAATAEDLFRAIDDADPRLAAAFDDFGGDAFVRSIGYDRDGDGLAAADPQDSFGETGDFIADFRFWEYLTAPDSPYDGSATWASEDFGISDRQLADGLWNGFRLDDAYPGPGPAPPAAAVDPAAVPEPTSVLLLACSLGSVAAMRRVRRRVLAQ